MKVALAPLEVEALQGVLLHQNASVSICLTQKRRKFYLDDTINKLAMYERYCENFLFQTALEPNNPYNQLTEQGQIVSGLLKKLRQCILFANDK